MWDEKKFFEDYVNESEKIKPDERFVEELKNMAAQEKRKKAPISITRYVAIAASFVLCIGLAGVVWQSQNALPKDKIIEYKVESQAGKNPTENQTEKKEPLSEILDMMRQGVTVRDEDGNELTQNQQEELWELLKNVKATEKPKDSAKTVSYFLEGEQTVKVEIWEDGFFQIEGKWYH